MPGFDNQDPTIIFYLQACKLTAFWTLCTPMKSISVVIPNYNGRNLLEANLPSVYEALEASKVTGYEIIIPDDASTDESASFLKENYPGIILIEATDNKGFSGNVNRGLSKASKDLVLILNSDVFLSKEYFLNLLPYFEIKDCFGVMGRIADPVDDHTQDGAKFPGYSFGKINGTKNYLVDKQNKLVTFFLSGANALVCREKMNTLGGFNELYNPFYHEDVDLGLRAWRTGYKLYYEHSAVCYHSTSSTIGKEKKSRVRATAQRNKIMLHYLHLPRIEWYTFIFIYVIKSLLSLVLLKPLYLTSLVKFLTIFPNVKRYRLTQRQSWRLSLPQITKQLKTDIKKYEINVF